MTGGRSDNFDAIRIAAASSVIFSHAFLIADGHERNEPFVRFLGQSHVLGVYGVFVFLIVSGFLVTQSLLTSPSLGNYIWKRFLRIYPGLTAYALVSAFVIAPLFAETHIKLDEKLDYIRDVLLMQPAWMNGVSFYEERIGTVINGSLWTIGQEIACYLIIALFSLFGGRWLVVLSTLGFGATTLLLSFNLYPPSRFFGEMLFCVPAFLGGSLMYFVHERWGRSGWIAAVCCIGLMVAGSLGYLRLSFPLFGAYIVVFLGLSHSINLGDATRFGDLSYGAYLYGWPIEQIVRAFTGGFAGGWKSLFAISLPLALACGWLSWHLIERHALRFKRWRPQFSRPVTP